ncbi:DUF2786 domain-containing protein [Caldimonas sp. KR1-144]|uniref:DUF2786 domain-containing protein n=1 Tax=Caldimonas sp. KR1-144 TaxID=3400911 RepID=UPI003C04DD49
MNRDQALAKIRKCLALGRSSNEHEAAAAMRQAQKLMVEHGLDAVDVDLAHVGEAESRAVMQTPVSWEITLAHLVAEAFGCQTFTTRRVLVGRTRSSVAAIRIFVGVGAAAEVAKYSFDVLSRQCAKARLSHIAKQPKNCKPITKTARGDQFANGWVHGVRDLVKRFAGNEQRTELLEMYMKRAHPDLVEVDAKRREVGRNVRHDDAWQGMEAGRQAKLHHGVGAEQRPLIASANGGA